MKINRKGEYNEKSEEMENGELSDFNSEGERGPTLRELKEKLRGCIAKLKEKRKKREMRQRMKRKITLLKRHIEEEMEEETAGEPTSPRRRKMK